jgi:hypothetical protein
MESLENVAVLFSIDIFGFALDNYIVIIRTSVAVIWSRCECPCLQNDAVVLAIAEGSEFVPSVT